MRKSTLSLIGFLSASILLALSCPIGALANGKLVKGTLSKSLDGGTSGGGGLIIYPQTKEIRSVINGVYSMPAIDPETGEQKGSAIYEVLKALDGRRQEVTDPNLNKIFNRLFSNLEIGTAVTAVARVTKYEIQDGPCIDRDNQFRAATVVAVNLGKAWPRSFSEFESYGSNGLKPYVKLCYSLRELAKVPKANLRQNVIALTIHELTHVFGYDEKTAVMVQNFVLGNGRQLVSIDSDNVDWIKLKTQIVSAQMDRLNENLRSEVKDLFLCTRIGSLTNEVQQIAYFMMDEDEKRHEQPSRPMSISKKIQDTAGKLYEDTMALYGFCGYSSDDLAEYGSNVSNNQTSPGNRNELAMRLQALEAQNEKLMKLLRVSN
jgi:hypothetical protein